MKESKYNVFLKEDPANPESPIIAFNGMTCSLAAMTPSEYEIFLKGRTIRSRIVTVHALCEKRVRNINFILQSKFYENCFWSNRS